MFAEMWGVAALAPRGQRADPGDGLSIMWIGRTLAFGRVARLGEMRVSPYAVAVLC